MIIKIMRKIYLLCRIYKLIAFINTKRRNGVSKPYEPVYIPTDIPLPSDKNFLDEIRDFLVGIIKMSKGNTFILFTSYSTLNYTYYLIRDELENLGFDLFIQGMAPRNQLINMYKASNMPVLFGTDSFWEGVDVQGEKLSSVILVKLPFKVPSDPVVEAIIENMDK